ncbi:MAG: S49 family peptidase [Aeromonas sp.]
MKQGLALRYLSSKPWAISSEILAVMGGIAARDLDSVDASSFGLPAPDALATRSGKVNQAGVEMRDGVAVIQVSGVISRYASMFEAICGGTSTQTLAKKVQAAIDDPSCRGVVLVVDSPGGEANGIHELAELVYSARDKKRITAYVSGSGCSAAYWIAAAAGRVVMDATAQVGSIGTVQTFRWPAEAEGKPQTLELVSSQSPDKRLDPRTEAGKEKYQAALDDLADVFIKCVAKYRGVTAKKVMDDFGQGWVLMGQAAVKAGMADALGSLEGVIKEMTNGGSVLKVKTDMAEQQGETLAAVTLAEGTPTGAAIEALTELRPDILGAMVGSVAVGLPEASEMSAADVVALIEECRPDALEAIKGPAPVMAVDAAIEVIQLATAAGVPAMASELIKEGVTLDAAKQATTLAAGLRDVLAAAGLSDSLGAIVAHQSDPVKMVAAAIHEAQAQATGNIDAEVKDKSKTAGIDYQAIYQEHNAK